MPIRSMTGFAQVRGQISHNLGFTISLKSVNHRFLDLHFRFPSDSDSLEMKLRRVFKERVARGHLEIVLNLDRNGGGGMALNRHVVGGYVQAFRAAAAEFGVQADPDLNAVLRMPGALDSSSLPADGSVEVAVLEKIDEALARLNEMREEEGRGIEQELRARMQRLQQATSEVDQHRDAAQKTYLDKLKVRMHELLGSQVDQGRLMQEAALLVDRSEIQEELVRLQTHFQHFLNLLKEGGEAGKKLDFLLQEMNREANTLLSKTSGLTGEAIKITELGLLMKAEIEKAREQVQNVE